MHVKYTPHVHRAHPGVPFIRLLKNRIRISAIVHKHPSLFIATLFYSLSLHHHHQCTVEKNRKRWFTCTHTPLPPNNEPADRNPPKPQMELSFYFPRSRTSLLWVAACFSGCVSYILSLVFSDLSSPPFF